MNTLTKIIGSLSTLSLISCGGGSGANISLPKSVDVFGVTILAAADVPDNKLTHAAHVMAQYLDNDADGVPDNSALVSTMVSNKATLVMVNNASDVDRINFGSLGTSFSQDLYASETHPNGASQQLFDASLEEVLHLISTAGYARLYPTVFGQNNSQQSAAMDTARGGKFTTIPSRYPEGAWYRYSDSTCNYSCQGDEYFYWSLTTLLGAQDYPWRKTAIANEWTLSTAAEFRETDQAMYRLLTNTTYKLPTTLPNGRYTGKTLVINNSTSSASLDTSLPAEVAAPNGKPTQRLTDTDSSEEKTFKVAKHVLEHLATEAPGSRLAADKSASSNSMANEETIAPTLFI